MVDKNLFLYDLAVTAIFKNEAPYLKEWLDYHLLAGVEHFYLYNNDSTDDYKKILAPYVEKNLVTLTDFPGKLMQYPAYNDAIEKYRFDCRYMAFIDIDEFIFPKSNRAVAEVVDEILSDIPNTAGLAINWQIFGSNGQEKADYSRGVLERFTRRAPTDWVDWNQETGFRGLNDYIKIIANPRLVRYFIFPHYAFYFDDNFAVYSDGKYAPPRPNSESVLADKIVINHYYVKSRQEYYKKKLPRGWTCPGDIPYGEKHFKTFDRNEIFDDGILKHRVARAENFSFESDDQKINRVINFLVRTLTKNSSEDSYVDKLETFLTCRAVAEKFQIKIGDTLAEEIALAWIYRILVKANPITRAEIQQFLKALPEILSRPFPICKEIKDLAQNFVLPGFCQALKNGNILSGLDDWKAHFDLLYLQKFLDLIK